MKVYLYESESQEIPVAIKQCKDFIIQEYELVDSLDKADIAVAPLLTKIIPEKDINKPRYGTLVFHPSLLPRHRGISAIKWAFAMGEKYTGVTWFWADTGIDTGDICEQEVLAIKDGESPLEFYYRAVIPAMERTLKRALNDVYCGRLRRVPQIKENGSYEPRFEN